MAETEELRHTLKDLCERAGFRRIVYVDDFFSPSASRMEDLLNELSLSQLVAVEGLGLDPGTEDEEFARAQAKKAVGRAVETGGATELFSKIAAAVEGTGESLADTVAIAAFRDALGAVDTVEVLELSMAKWKAESQRLLSEAEIRTRTLFIFDDDFRLEDLGPEAGRQALQAVTQRLAGKRHAAVLLTHKARNEVAEREIESDLRTARGCDAIMVVSKEPLGRSSGPLIRRVKHALLQEHFTKLQGFVVEALKASADNALKAIQGMGVDEFERILVHSSINEGAWCPETMIRVVGVNQEKAVRRSLRSDGRIHRAISEIEPLAGLDTGRPGESVREQAYRLQHAEVMDGPADIEGLSLPLELGDVFTLKKRRFILVAQSCELAVRSDGSRSRDKDRLVALVEIAPPPKDGVSSSASLEASTPPAGTSASGSSIEPGPPPKSRTVRRNQIVVTNGEPGGGDLVVLMDSVTWVPPWLLDLTVFSSSGECELASDSEGSPHLPTPWRLRIASLKERVIEEVVSLYSAMRFQPDSEVQRAVAQALNAGGAAPPSLRESDRVRVLCSLLRLPLGCKFRPSLELGANGRWHLKITDLRRTHRVRARHSTPLLLAFAQHAARPALPHELTNIELPQGASRA